MSEDLNEDRELVILYPARHTISSLTTAHMYDDCVCGDQRLDNGVVGNLLSARPGAAQSDASTIRATRLKVVSGSRGDSFNAYSSFRRAIDLVSTFISRITHSINWEWEFQFNTGIF